MADKLLKLFTEINATQAVLARQLTELQVLLEAQSAAPSATYAFTGKDFAATGIYNPATKEFTVKAGSITVGIARMSLSDTYRQYRLALYRAGTIKLIDGKYTFTSDHTFASPSAAASVIAGSNRNGRECWRDSSGHTLGSTQ